MARLKYGLRSKLCPDTEDTAEWSKRSLFSPAQPPCAETRLSAGEAAALRLTLFSLVTLHVSRLLEVTGEQSWRTFSSFC